MVFNPSSPGVYITEVNVSTVVPTVATTVGAIAGIFNWGPLFSPTLITSQQELVDVFGKPNSNNYETWFSAWNFLEYADQLFVVRTSMINPVSNTTVNTIPNTAMVAVSGNTTFANVGWAERTLVTNASYNSTTFQNFLESNQSAPNTLFAAKYPGALGTSLRVGFCTSPQQFHSYFSLNGSITSGNSAGNSYTGVFNINPGAKTGYIVFTATSGSNTANGIAAGNLYANTLESYYLANGDYWSLPTYNRQHTSQSLQVQHVYGAITNAIATTVRIDFKTPYSGSQNCAISYVQRWWEYYKISPSPVTGEYISSYQANSSNPTQQDLINLVVVDQLGYITGIPNTVLETWNYLSRATDAVDVNNNSMYYRTVLNNQSKWIRAFNDIPGYSSNTANNLGYPSTNQAPTNVNLTGGLDGDSESVAPLSTLINGWELFQGADNIKINLVIAGKSTGQSNTQAGDTNTTYGNFDLPNWLINNIAEKRQDCVVFFSPDKSIVVNNAYNYDIPTDLVNWAGILSSSDRAVLDCNYKYQYDQYNSVFRWVPFNGDIAGLCVYTDTVSYPWFSPAGFNRGQISNVTKLAWNPQQGDRDYIYPNAINPIVQFPGQGVYLYGDRTFTTQPSAFDRINVRRMFLYIEQAIKIAARYTLFEINDVFTQNAFKNMVTPFLKAVQANRGITDFQVICDATINTPTVVDGNQFLCAVLVKPARSINYINITFFAVPDGVDFSTVPLTY